MKLQRAFYLSGIATLAVLTAAPAHADDQPAANEIADASQDAPVVVDQADTSDTGDENAIIVIANALRGQIEAPQPPVIELNEEDIASYGASSLADLVQQLATETGSGSGRGSGRPVFLVNGLRVSSFREMFSYPPEAIKRVEVLPEAVAQQYGYPPDQRVINFILKDNFSSRTAELQYGQPFDGGTSTVGGEGTLLNIAGSNRLNFDLQVKHTSPLTEAERGVVQSVTPQVPGDPDQAAYRTLVDKNTDYKLTGNWTHGLGEGGASLTVNGAVERNDSLSYSGLNTVVLTNPSDESVLRIFGEDFPLARRTRTDTLSFGSTLNAHAGDWQLTGTLDASHADSTSKIDRRADTAALVAAAAVGTMPIDAPITGISYPGYDTAESKTDSASSKFTARGHPVTLPAGDISVTLDAGYDWNRINSSDTRTLNSATRLTRGDLNGGVNVSIPIASRRYDVLAGIGDLTANLSGGLDHLSDFGTLTNWSAGLNWGPAERLNFQANYIVREAAPGLSQLGAPSVINYNVPVYDFTTGQTVLVSITTGGNPDLSRETQRDLHLAVAYDLPLFDRSNIRVEYFRNNSDNVSAAFPLLTPEIEAAFPGRVTRDASGNLVSIDERPVTFAKENSSRIRIGLNISGRIGGSSESGGSRRGGGGFRGPPGGPAAAGGPPEGEEGGGPPPGGPPTFGGGNFNRQAFAEFRQKLCAADATTPPDISALPGQMRTRLSGPDGKPDPKKIAELKERVCNGNGAGAFNPQAFAQLRQTLCPTDKDIDVAKLPPEVLDRFKGDNGQVDQARLKEFRTRICSFNPQQAQRQQGQQAQDRQAQGGSQQQQSSQNGGDRRGGGGPGFFPGRGRGGNFGRWNLSLSDTIELQNTVLVAPGGPLLDQLHGDAVSGSGVPRNILSLEGGVFYNGLGLRFSGNYKSGTHVTGSGLPGSSDLNFGSLFTLDLRMFADLGRQDRLVKAVPFFKGARVSLDITNLFDTRQKVTDQNGDVPLRYQPYLIDPTGRSFRVEFRKMF